MLVNCISIRQPWAWLIVRPDLLDISERRYQAKMGIIKDIENRTWMNPRTRGPLYIHAAKRYADNVDYNFIYDNLGPDQYEIFKRYKEVRGFQIGGIIGRVMISEWVKGHNSKWFEGPCGIVIRDPEPIEIIKMQGKLGIFTTNLDSEDIKLLI